MEKEHLEIILEDIRGKLDLVLVGQAVKQESGSRVFDPGA